MFTGLVEELGTVLAIDSQPIGARVRVAAGPLVSKLAIGDSLAINGCCLTVIENEDDAVVFDAGEETLRRTNLGELAIGSNVNLETSVAAGQPMGGHFVTGHIDGTGVVDQRTDDGDWTEMWFKVPGPLTRQMASKGSVAVDGVSLTLVDVEDDRFSVALIPHTLKVTTLGERAVGHTVNIETDVLAKYVERQLSGDNDTNL